MMSLLLLNNKKRVRPKSQIWNSIINILYKEGIKARARRTIWKKNVYDMRKINHLFTAARAFRKKALLVQLGRTWVSKTRCGRFKSYRA
jgi:hypothetical protein